MKPRTRFPRTRRAVNRTPLDAVKLEFVGLLADLCRAFALPPSRGFIYGLVLLSPDPVCFDDVVARFDISSGSASQGLRWLKERGIVRPIVDKKAAAGRGRRKPRDRREYLVPEPPFDAFVKALLDEHVAKPLEAGSARLQRVREQFDLAWARAETKTAGESGLERGWELLRDRIARLEAWHQRAQSALPALVRHPG